MYITKVKVEDNQIILSRTEYSFQKVYSSGHKMGSNLFLEEMNDRFYGFVVRSDKVIRKVLRPEFFMYKYDLYCAFDDTAYQDINGFLTLNMVDLMLQGVLTSSQVWKAEYQAIE